MRPILLDYHGLEIRSFGVLAVLGWSAGLFVARKQAISAGLDGPVMNSCWFWALIAACIGARLPRLFSVPSVDVLSRRQFIDRLEQSGLSSVSALFTATLIAIAVLHINKKSILRYADAATAGVLISLAFCRLGCFLNGCCFGVPTEYWWGCSFDPNSPAGSYAAAIGVTLLIPVQLMLAFGNLAVAAFSFVLKSVDTANGTTCRVTVAIYSSLQLLVAEYRVSSAEFTGVGRICQGPLIWLLIGAATLLSMTMSRSRTPSPR